MELLLPEQLHLFHEPKDRLRLTATDRSFVTVKPVWSAPLSHPQQYLSLLNGKGEEIVLIPSLDSLARESRTAVEMELAKRYLTAQVQRILEAKTEFGATYWTVETERGTREFVTQSLQENAQWLSAQHLLLIDVDGNRFELPDIHALDDKSRQMLFAVV
jgi:hypothetical protein